MPGRDLVVRLVGIAEGWDKAAKTAQSAIDDTTSKQKSAVETLEAAQKRAEGSITASEDRIKAAKDKAADAAAKVAIAEQKAAEDRKQYGDDSSRALQAELKLEQAKRQAAAASGQVTREENMQQDARKQLIQITKDLKVETEKAADAQSEMADEQDSYSGGSLVGELGKIAGAAAAAAGAFSLVKDGWAQAMESASGQANTQASLGLTDEQAANAGKAAGELYASNWGDSVSDTNAAVESVMGSISGMRDASVEDLQAVTEQALGLSDAFDIDVSEAARNAGIWINNGLADNATEAFDVMAAGLQQVPEALRGEVMDATQEYAQYFGQLGLDGSQAMQLLVDASANGQYGIDKLGDSLKEFTIRASDLGDSGAQQALANLGLSGEDVANKLLAGGDSAQEAMQQVVGALQGVEDPAAQAQAAVALFGTPIEDLGKDQIPGFLDSLSGVSGGMGDVSGAAQNVADTISESADPFETLKRSLTTTISEGLEPFLVPAQAIADWAQENPGALTAIVAVLGGLAAAYVGVSLATTVMTTATEIATGAQELWNLAMKANPIGLVITGIMLLVAAFVWLWNNVEPFREFWIGVWDAIKGAALAVADWFTGTLVPWFQGVWDTIGAGIQALADWFSARFDDIKNAAQTVGDFFTVTVPGFFQAAWDLVMEKVNGLKDAAITAFQWLRDGVGEALDGIRSAAAKPINFVITTVYENGLRKLVQGVIDLFHLPFDLPHIDPIALARGAMMGDGQRPILWNEVPGQREAYIPINSSARSRGLWEQTGREIGAIPMAYGGIWPVNGTITSGYGYRNGPFYGAELHDGLDIGAALGTAVTAALPGVVDFAGWNGGYGNYVRINHGDGLKTFYGHLSSILAAVGDMVEAGTLIGLVGSTGASTGPHLHFGASMNGASMDPSSILDGAGTGSGGSSFGLLSRIGEIIDSLKEIGDSTFAQIVGGAVGGVLDGVKGWFKDKLGSLFSSSSSTDGGDFSGWWDAAIAVAGGRYAQYRDAVYTVAQHESGLNPNASNGWDSNAAAGTPSKGLMQFIEPTFDAYAWPGHHNWMSPVDQILAFFRYAEGRYGGVYNVPGLVALGNGRGYVGYDSGGWLAPGVTPTLNATGRPEAVLTGDQWTQVTALILGMGQLLAESGRRDRVVTVRLTDDQLARLLEKPTVGTLNVAAASGEPEDLLDAVADALEVK